MRVSYKATISYKALPIGRGADIREEVNHLVLEFGAEDDVERAWLARVLGDVVDGKKSGARLNNIHLDFVDGVAGTAERE